MVGRGVGSGVWTGTLWWGGDVGARVEEEVRLARRLVNGDVNEDNRSRAVSVAVSKNDE